MSSNNEILDLLITDLKKRVREEEQKEFTLENINKPEEKKKKILHFLLLSCVNQPQEVFLSIKTLIDSKITDNELINFINFCDLHIQAQERAYQISENEISYANERYEYLSKLYDISVKDMKEVSDVHNPANSFEEIEFRKAKKTDKIERTFQHMINDMVYLVDFLNRKRGPFKT